jgi:ribonuclease HII
MAGSAGQDADDVPTLAREGEHWACGALCVAGVDEVGRGAWAGPVVAAAVVLPADPAIAEDLRGVRDSKAVPPPERAHLAALIRDCALATTVGMAPAALVDGAGVLSATAHAMNEALVSLERAPDHVLVDGLHVRGLVCPQTPIVRGDACCLSIAAASIVAKVTRDRWMAELDTIYPGYGFAGHKGYGTPAHRAALCQLGPCPVHRLSYAPVAAIVAQSWV